MSLLLIPLSIAVVDWLALARGWVRVDYLAKPGVLLALMTWLWVYTRPEPGVLVIWISVGLAFSLVGDVLLMLPKERFLGGLVAFFLAHLAYILALNPDLPPLHLSGLTLAFLVGILWWTLLRSILAGLRARGKEKLIPPILVYTLLISLMLFSAWMLLFRESWPQLAAGLIAGGATLFFLSDLLLAWNRFVRPVPLARLYVRILYHSGQIALAGGAALATAFI